MFGEKKKRRFVCYSILGLCLNALLVSCGDPIGGVGTSVVFLYTYQTAGEDSAIEADVSNIKSVSADITIKSSYRDPTKSTATDLANVILTEQRVTYYRSDGNPNVPESFQESINLLVPAGGEVKAEVIILRPEAKLKSPLKELLVGGGEGLIHLNALIKFYGKDLAGKSVFTEVTIYFDAADFVDE